ncbi:hypothetical protein IQ07DRAFT_249439 [Pyrenochaeta sp. DS3sAY3a]|nr:hypothetical protein IQ07DRAFT_249439 [Pyrenochaeta sp. DS3sAY3a]
MGGAEQQSEDGGGGGTGALGEEWQASDMPERVFCSRHGDVEITAEFGQRSGQCAWRRPGLVTRGNAKEDGSPKERAGQRANTVPAASTVQLRSTAAVLFLRARGIQCTKCCAVKTAQDDALSQASPARPSWGRGRRQLACPTSTRQAARSPLISTRSLAPNASPAKTALCLPALVPVAAQ